jgi:hypothetical protein
VKVFGKVYKQQISVIFGENGIYLSKKQLNEKIFPRSPHGLSFKFHFEAANPPKLHSFF